MIGRTLDDEIQALARLDLAGLRSTWRERWRSEPPTLRSRSLMSHAFAYKLQAAAEGDLDSATRRRLNDLGRRFADDRSYRPTSGPALAIGCTLVREWGGFRHEVKVVEGGFAYQGETHPSLSGLAQHITGAKRSGQLFFGLKAKAP